MKSKTFPENPFLMTFSKIAIVDALVVLATALLALWKEGWLWFIVSGGVLVAIAVFVVLNKQCLRELSCPQCHRHVKFEAGEGFVCKNCNTGWELG